MARQADGSIVIDTKIDDAKLKKGISNIGTSLKGITKLVATAFSVKVIYIFKSFRFVPFSFIDTDNFSALYRKSIV